MRIKVIRIGIICLFLVIVLDLFYVQAIRGRYFYNLSKNNRIRVVPLEGWRGRILDRNGKVLADNRMSYNVMVTPQDVKDTQKLFHFLSEVLKIDQKKIIQKYRQREFTPYTPVNIVENISREQAIILEENKYRFPSLLVQESFKRFYPLNRNSANVLGYVGKISRAKRERFKEYGYSPQSVIGYSGVEEYYDDDLKGGGGGLQIEVDSRGRQVRLLSLKEPIKGQDIVLTIDSSIQQSALELLDDKIGTIIVMDMDNGEILGLTSSPAFDPNILVQSEGDANKRRIAALFSNPSSPFLNRAIKGLFPPGSVFKVAVAIGALDSKKITQHTPFVCTGVFELGGRKFRCTHAHGTQNLIESIVHSCNVYFYHLGLILGADTISHYAKQLGLGSLTHIDLPYEGVGNVPSRRQRLLSGGGRWYAGDTLNLSIGQGDVLVTPIQLVRMMATIARNGVEVQPHLIKAIGGLEVAKYLTERQIKIDKKHFQTVQKALRATVSNYSGTAHVLDIQDLHIAGKTGTAQTSGGRENHAWFVGYVKGKKRNFSFCVFLEHGGSSQNACILARQLLLKMQNEKIL